MTQPNYRPEAPIDASEPHTMPRPTVWPATLAAGMTLAPAGIMLGAVTTLLGVALIALGIAGWVRELLIEFPAEGSTAERQHE